MLRSYALSYDMAYIATLQLMVVRNQDDAHGDFRDRISHIYLGVLYRLDALPPQELFLQDAYPDAAPCFLC